MLHLAVAVGLVACGPAPALPAVQAEAEPAPLAVVKPADPEPSPFGEPPGLEARLLAATEIEVFSLDPFTPDLDGFRAYHVLGSVKVQDLVTRQTAVRELFRNFHPPPKKQLLGGGGMGPAYCFEPRLGVRAVDAAGTVDLLICFACGRMRSWSPDFRASDILYWGYGDQELQSVLREGGVAIAPDGQPKPRYPSVHFLERPTIDGPRVNTTDVVRRILRAHTNAVRGCYMRTGPGRAVRFTARFTVDQVGRVSAASIREGLEADSELARCIVDALERLRFPRAKAGGDSVVTQRFELAMQ